MLSLIIVYEVEFICLSFYATILFKVIIDILLLTSLEYFHNFSVLV
uniref:Uncharacterized protein n=1 Tax=Anguilla anguilla TaxID=7936 RepID=A0A0E9UR34_ANGAN